MAKLIGLDLGTVYTRIWTQDKGIVLRCPSAAAIDSQSHEVVALGVDAKKMLGKTPEDILAYRPVKDGVIEDYEVAARMLNEFFSRKRLSSLFNRPTVLLSTPYRITEVERLAVENAVFDAGARAVAQVPVAMAAAAGAGLRIHESRGSMIVDMGGGTTEAAIISSGGMITANSIRVGGERLDMAIVNYLKNHCNLLIGESVAETLKLQLGTADPRMKRGEMTVYGLNTRTGLGATAVVNSRLICEAITPSLEAISRALVTVLEHDVPPEIAGDIYTLGMMLCGGCSLLPGLPEFLHKRIGLRVTVAKNPLDCVCLGLGRIAQHPSLLGEPLEYRMK